MNRQIPPPVFAAGVLLALLLAIFLVGRTPPTGSNHALIGKAAPAFSGAAPDGASVTLAKYRGKVVLVNFWATWCGPCRREMPDFVRLQSKYESRGFTIVGLTQDDSDPADVAKFAREQGLNYPLALVDVKTGRDYGGIRAIPATFIVDRDGVIRYYVEGVTTEDALAPVIEHYL